MKYYSLVTDAGSARIAQAAVSGEKVSILYFAAGDGGGTYYEPESNMTALRHEVWRGEVGNYQIDADDILQVGAVIPSNAGGFTVRELALFDDAGTMIAICNTPDLEKTALAEGAASELELTMQIVVSSTEAVTFDVDPNVINATKKDLELHNGSTTAHASLFNSLAKKDLSNVPSNILLQSLKDADIMTGLDAAAKCKAVSVTLRANSWIGDGPFTQSVGAAGVTAGNHIAVALASSATATQYAAVGKAKLLASRQGNGTITVSSFGKKPDTDIPLQILIFG